MPDSTANSTTISDQSSTDHATESQQAYVYVVPGLGTFDTRHEAIGVGACNADWPVTVVPMRPDAVCRPHWYPEHLGNKYFGDRDWIPTTGGVIRVEQESLIRTHNGNHQEVVESQWEMQCPVCCARYESDEATEDARSALLDEVLACCDTEWIPPTDWVADCEICGDSHRGTFNCLAPAYRDPFPGVDETYTCAVCDWTGHGTMLASPTGNCPQCDATAVTVTTTTSETTSATPTDAATASETHE